MLCYGNFIYAYRTLSRIEAEEALTREVGDWARDPAEIVRRFESRSPKLVDIDPIPRADTPLVGYLSAGEIIAECERARLLKSVLPSDAGLPRAEWDSYRERVRGAAKPEEHPPLLSVLDNFRARSPEATVTDFANQLAEVLPLLEGREQVLAEVRRKATRNQDVYLTWDYMAVYFATSMRKRWEYEDLYDFVNGLMAHPELIGLKLRHFDPTQAYTANRVNKGLVEALMLKRAHCTVYSVQDTDTLSKDSDLAATLAQGKPVIAYVPEIPINARIRQLMDEPPATVQDRLRFVIYADDQFAQSLQPDDLEFLRSFTELERYERGRVWRSVPDVKVIDALRAAHGGEIERVCRIVVRSEKRIYDRRARTLQQLHPLGIQVNLATGVANGVLVVRTVEACAKLLRAVLTNAMEFELEDSPGDQMWYLKERISGCVYRVVSRDRKLTNCF